MGDGRRRVITGEVAPVMETRDPQRFQAECVEAFVASQIAESTIANDVGVLERMLAALGRSAWEVTAEDVDRVVGALDTGRNACIGVSEQRRDGQRHATEVQRGTAGVPRRMQIDVAHTGILDELRPPFAQKCPDGTAVQPRRTRGAEFTLSRAACGSTDGPDAVVPGLG